VTDPAVDALLDAAAVAEGVLRDPAVGDRWAESSALPRMTVGDVAGHLFLAFRHGLRTVRRAPIPDGVAVTTLGGWYGGARMADDADIDREMHVQIRTDGHHVGGRGWPNVVDRFIRVRQELIELAPQLSSQPLVLAREDPPVVVPLADYLSTRVIEVVVHTDDIAVSVDAEPPPFEADTLGVAIAAMIRLNRARSGDIAVVRALARPSRAPSDTLRTL
jgi:hypothetical protein